MPLTMSPAQERAYRTVEQAIRPPGAAIGAIEPLVPLAVTTTADAATTADTRLMEGVARHQADAFALLYRRHAGSVMAAARHILGNRPLCEDVVADVFVALWVAPGTFDPARGSLAGFLYTKARGRSIDVLRAESSRRRREERDARDDRREPHGPESAIIERDDSACVRHALSLLPEDEREPIVLAFFFGLTYRSTAIQLGLPEGTVKSRIRNGLRRLGTNETLQRQRAVEDGIDAGSAAGCLASIARPTTA